MTVEIFDSFNKIMSDKGWNSLDSIINAGITKRKALEIGSGPGYVGLECSRNFLRQPLPDSK